MANLIALPAGTRLVDDFTIGKVLGAGGFGITYLAEETALARPVTIKEYFPADFAGRDENRHAVPRSQDSDGDYQWGLDRFIEEAKILARFNHPNIVRVYRYFQANRTAYMVLHFEEGQSLKAWLKGLGRAPRQSELDRLLEPLLEALCVIHADDYLHRDIAPDNIIIRTDGSPVLIDFGSARGEMAGHSKTVSALVKPGYSPYEQYAENGRQQGPWTDIYALAATIYHAVTGKRPPDAPSRMVHDDYVPAREAALGGYRKRFLAAIDKALSLGVDERPQSVAAWRGELLAPDGPNHAPARKPVPEPRKQAGIGSWFSAPRNTSEASANLDGERPLSAHMPPSPDAPGRPGGMADFVDGLRGHVAADETNSSPRDGLTERLMKVAPDAPDERARAGSRQTRHGPAAGADVISKPKQKPGAHREETVGDASPAAAGTVKLTSPTPAFSLPGFGANRRKAAAAKRTAEGNGKPEPGGRESAASPLRYDPATPFEDALADEIPAPAPPGAIGKKRSPGRAGSAGEASAAAGSSDVAASSRQSGRPAFWQRWQRPNPAADRPVAERAPSRPRRRPGAEAGPGALEQAASANRAAPGANLPVLKQPARPAKRPGRIRAATSALRTTASLAGKLAVGGFIAAVVVTNQDQIRSFFETGSFQVAGNGSTIQRASGPLTSAPPPNANPLTRARAAEAARLAAIQEGERERERLAASQARFASARSTAESVSPPLSRSGEPLTQTPAPFASAQIAPAASRPQAGAPPSVLYENPSDRPTPLLGTSAIATGAVPAAIIQPEPLQANPLIRQVDAHTGPALAVTTTPDGRYFLTSGEDDTLKVWQTSDLAPVRTIRIDHGPAISLAVQGSLVATGHRDGHIGIWNVGTGTKVIGLHRNEASIWALQFTNTQGQIAAATHDWKVLLWDLKTPDAPLHVLEGHDSAVNSLALSRDGRYLASGGADKRVRLWDLDTLETRRTYPTQKDFVTALAFSGDDRSVATAALDGGLRVYSTRSRRLLRRLSGHDREISAMAFSPDGDVLATASLDGFVRLWDVKKRATLRSLPNQGVGASGLAFSARGNRLASVGEDGRLRLWSVPAALD